MSWRQLWDSESGEETETGWSDFKAYWTDRCREAYVKARVRGEAIGFAVYLLGGSLLLDKTIWLIGLGVFVIGFLFELCFICPLNHAKSLAEKINTLEKLTKSRINVSCGKSVDKSVVPIPAAGEMWFRARLDLKGCTPIPDIEATVTELWEDGKRISLHENLTLTMFPGPQPAPDLRTLNEGKAEFVDIIRVFQNGTAIFPQKFYSRAVDQPALLKPNHTYRITVIISSPSNRADRCTFEFEWTGDPSTSDIKLISVTPPS